MIVEQRPVYSAISFQHHGRKDVTGSSEAAGLLRQRLLLVFSFGAVPLVIRWSSAAVLFLMDRVPLSKKRCWDVLLAHACGEECLAETEKLASH